MELDVDVIGFTNRYLKDSRDLNRRIIGALNAGHRQRLLEEKNRLVEAYENQIGLNPSKPGPVPDLPVFDLRAMDDVVTREAELKILAAEEPAKFSLKSKIGLVVATVIFLATITVVTFQVRSFNADVKPVLTSQEGRRGQVQELLVQIGDRETITESTSIQDLEERLGLVRKAVRALALGGTDEKLEKEVNLRRELIKAQIERLVKQR